MKPGTAWAVGICVSASVVSAADRGGVGPKESLTINQVGGSLGEFVDRISKASGDKHVVKAPLNESGMLALSKNATLILIRGAIARNWEATWQASAPGSNREWDFQLYVSLQDRRTREAAASRLESKSRAEMPARLDSVRRMAFADRQQLTALADSGDSKAKALLHPRSGAMQKLAFGLPAEAWKSLQTRGIWEAPVASLSREIQDLARGAAGTDRISVDGGEGVALSDLVGSGTVRLQMGGTPDRPTIWGGLRFAGNGFDVNMLYAEGWGRQPPEERREQIRRKRAKRPTEPDLLEKVTLRDVPRKVYVEPGNRPVGAKPIVELLKDLSKQTQLRLIGQCEYEPKNEQWLGKQWWLAEDIVEKPLYAALDLLCADFEYEWQFHNGFILLRPKLWFLSKQERVDVRPPPLKLQR